MSGAEREEIVQPLFIYRNLIISHWPWNIFMPSMVIRLIFSFDLFQYFRCLLMPVSVNGTDSPLLASFICKGQDLFRLCHALTCKFDYLWPAGSSLSRTHLTHATLYICSNFHLQQNPGLKFAISDIPYPVESFTPLLRTSQSFTGGEGMGLDKLVDQTPFLCLPTAGLQIFHGISAFLRINDLVDPAQDFAACRRSEQCHDKILICIILASFNLGP